MDLNSMPPLLVLAEKDVEMVSHILDVFFYLSFISIGEI